MAVSNKALAIRPLFDRLKRFWRDARAELRKVSWPNRKELTTYTIVVLVVTAIVSLFIGVVDLIFSEILRLLGLLRG
ncbi:MAG TPA: preprotein translocase subunit SecE [Firmicutes bacterium]|nr:preprotein translocase subunit SecE [Bacillota bacterium]